MLFFFPKIDAEKLGRLKAEAGDAKTKSDALAVIAKASKGFYDTTALDPTSVLLKAANATAILDAKKAAAALKSATDAAAALTDFETELADEIAAAVAAAKKLAAEKAAAKAKAAADQHSDAAKKIRAHAKVNDERFMKIKQAPKQVRCPFFVGPAHSPCRNPACGPGARGSKACRMVIVQYCDGSGG